MVDSLEMFKELNQIRTRIEAIEHTQEVLVRAHAEAIEMQIWDRMDSDEILAQVFLLVDGSRTQTDIVAALQDGRAPGASHATVSRKLDLLSKELHIVELIGYSKAGKVYRKTALDRILGIGRKLARRRANLEFERR